MKIRIITHRFVGLSLLGFVLGVGLLALRTFSSFSPAPETLSVANAPIRKIQVLDRQAIPLSITYQNDWNMQDTVSLHAVPETLQQIFLLAEDKRFYEHHGPDWYARFHAMLQNIKSLEVVRGASTITEQSVRIIYPRSRTFWSRWVEGFEATRLEQRFSKADILEFYLNQVPYANRRRGVVQAARHYFDRSLATLDLKEMMALAVLVRAPSRLDLHKGTEAIETSIQRLAERALTTDLITADEYQAVLNTPLKVRESQLPVHAPHFVRHIYALHPEHYLQTSGRVYTTLQASLQRTAQAILAAHLHDLRHKNVHHGAALILDHQNDNTVRAWVNAHTSLTTASDIDAIITPRQPGSTLKPFLYALALEKGWTAATLIDDAPVTTPVGTGIHNYRNYSRYYYGHLRLRDALGNSLNTPAIRAVEFVGVAPFLSRLYQLGIKSLTAPADYYGEGLALGNGEITLLELVQAYATLANKGVFRPAKFLRDAPTSTDKLVFSPEISTLIANILSDPEARRLEFGRSDLLRFPVQTAVKTGTSTDYRDAWAVGFNYRYTVGVWLGNLDQQPMREVSGASGAGLILRALFAELNRYEETQPLYLSSQLVKADICRANGQPATAHCARQTEWFIPEHLPLAVSPQTSKTSTLYLQQPSEGLQLAMDPRIPDAQESFALRLSNTPQTETAYVEWRIDNQVVGITQGKTQEFLWPLKRGQYRAQAQIWQAETTLITPTVTFYVK